MPKLTLKEKIGFIILNIANLGPFYMSLKIIFDSQTSLGAMEKWPLFFSMAGPLQLLMSAVILEISVHFFIIKKNKFAWWSSLLATIWIGLNDSISILVFYVKYPLLSPFPLAPFVSSGIILGLILMKDYVFEKEAKGNQESDNMIKQFSI